MTPTDVKAACNHSQYLSGLSGCSSDGDPFTQQSDTLAAATAAGATLHPTCYRRQAMATAFTSACLSRFQLKMARKKFVRQDAGSRLQFSKNLPQEVRPTAQQTVLTSAARTRLLPLQPSWGRAARTRISKTRRMCCQQSYWQTPSHR